MNEDNQVAAQEIGEDASTGEKADRVALAQPLNECKKLEVWSLAWRTNEREKRVV